MNLKDTKINTKAALIKEQINDRISKGATSLEVQLLNEFQDDRGVNLIIDEKYDDEKGDRMKLKETLINAKTAFIKEEVDDRIAKGAKVTEIQLLDEFQHNKEIDLSIIKDIDVSVIHMPLIEGEDYDIETVEGRETFKKVCQLASRIGILKGHDIMVVIHTTTSLTRLKKFGMDDIVITAIRDEISKYNNVHIAIENSVNYDYSEHKGKLHQNDTYYIENNELKLANVELAKAVNHERCGVCFDTCHAIMTEHHLNYVNQLFEGYIENVYRGKNVLEIMFEQSVPMLKLIHLAYTEKHGYNNYHGLPFTNDSFPLLKYISDLYDKYNATCPATIEVYEDDLNDAVNYITTLNEIEKL